MLYRPQTAIRGTGEQTTTCVKLGKSVRFEVIVVANMKIVALYPENGSSRFPETMVLFYQTTQLYIPEHRDLQERSVGGIFQCTGATENEWCPPCCVTANAKTPLLSIAGAILRCFQQRRVISLLLSDDLERFREEPVVTSSRYDPDIYLEVFRKIIKNL
jgi:hypothetical protein